VNESDKLCVEVRLTPFKTVSGRNGLG